MTDATVRFLKAAAWGTVRAPYGGAPFAYGMQDSSFEMITVGATAVLGLGHFPVAPMHSMGVHVAHGNRLREFLSRRTDGWLCTASDPYRACIIRVIACANSIKCSFTVQLPCDVARLAIPSDVSVRCGAEAPPRVKAPFNAGEPAANVQRRAAGEKGW